MYCSPGFIGHSGAHTTASHSACPCSPGPCSPGLCGSSSTPQSNGGAVQQSLPERELCCGSRTAGPAARAAAGPGAGCAADHAAAIASAGSGWSSKRGRRAPPRRGLRPGCGAGRLLPHPAGITGEQGADLAVLAVGHPWSQAFPGNLPSRQSAATAGRHDSVACTEAPAGSCHTGSNSCWRSIGKHRCGFLSATDHRNPGTGAGASIASTSCGATSSCKATCQAGASARPPCLPPTDRSAPPLPSTSSTRCTAAGPSTHLTKSAAAADSAAAAAPATDRDGVAPAVLHRDAPIQHPAAFYGAGGCQARPLSPGSCSSPSPASEGGIEAFPASHTPALLTFTCARVCHSRPIPGNVRQQ